MLLTTRDMRSKSFRLTEDSSDERLFLGNSLSTSQTLSELSYNLKLLLSGPPFMAVRSVSPSEGFY